MFIRNAVYLLLICSTANLTLASDIETGIALFENKKFDEARQFFTNFISDNPDNACGFYYLGRVCFAKQDYKKAEVSYKTAIELENDNSTYHHWLGLLYISRIQKASIFKKVSLSKKARRHLEKAVQIDSSNAAARKDLFAYYLNAPGIAGGSIDKALEHAQVLLKLNEGKGRFALVQIYIKKEQLELAEKEYKLCEEIVGDNPEDNNFYNSYGYFLLRRNKVDEAIEKFEKQVALTPEAANPYDSLGDGYRAAGHLQEAKAAYLKALGIDPEFKAAKKNLRNVEKELKKSVK